ncbi:MAG TPA: DAHL domain-containing protein [Oligoflexus sp.]|uniref:DAHL domain-containing protein n=1 Tax=Oligoflexus sp. TaxID=1971216 RepID=UPI002D28A365|nr:DAHL domain-containing protein [Oligoflexus sp.]HYX34161.1 DAHL domain-containing protein [Oligoflexus sp.]
MKGTRAGLILLAGSMFLGLAWAWSMARDVAWEKMVELNNQIREITYADSALDLEVLRIRSGVVAHYDDVSQASQALQKSLQKLQARITTLHIQQPDMEGALARLQEQIHIKLRAVETLKAQNSILRNSESYLPALLHEYSQRHSEDSVHSIQSLLLRTLVLPDPHAVQSLKVQFQSLVPALVPLDLTNIQTRVALHGMKALDIRQTLQTSLHDFLNIPVHDSITQLNQASIKEQEQQENIRERFRNILYLSAFSFFSLSLFILWRFIRLNRKTKSFVPFEMLSLLGKKTLLSIEYGTSIQREMTVMFVDLRDFSRTCEVRQPAENFAFVNEYLAAITPAIQNHRGFVSQFTGDGVMALFPGSGDDALHAAMDLIHTLSALNQRRHARGDDILHLGIGINTSELMLGTIGHQKRMECTVLGNGVNIAARVEGLTRIYGCEVLLTESTVRRLQHPESFQLRMIDRVRPKGLQEPLQLFELLDPSHSEQHREKSRKAIEFQNARLLYQQRNFQAAAAIFASISRHDSVSAVYHQRCLDLMAAAPVADWDRVADFSSK